MRNYSVSQIFQTKKGSVEFTGVKGCQIIAANLQIVETAIRYTRTGLLKVKPDDSLGVKLMSAAWVKLTKKV